MRDDGHTGYISFKRSYGPADAIQGDRSLVDYVAVEIGRYPDFEPPIAVGERVQRDELACAVDVALHDVATQPVAHGGWALQIHERAFAEGAEIGARQCFGRKIAPDPQNPALRELCL